jgi:hypothetical protein
MPTGTIGTTESFLGSPGDSKAYLPKFSSDKIVRNFMN